MKQVGWIDIQKEEGYNPTYRPRMLHQSGPQTHLMSGAVAWFEFKLNKRVVAIVVTDTLYRVCLEEGIETPISAEV